MAEFLNRFGVTEQLHNLIEDAREYIILISPYFKLNDLIKKSLSRHKYNKNFHLVIVYDPQEKMMNYIKKYNATHYVVKNNKNDIIDRLKYFLQIRQS